MPDEGFRCEEKILGCLPREHASKVFSGCVEDSVCKIVVVWKGLGIWAHVDSFDECVDGNDGAVYVCHEDVFSFWSKEFVAGLVFED